jgi:phospholipid/cholesterol/gamma-HCH transport system ATP-binding protein
VIRAQGLTVGYGRQAVQTGLDFEVEAGELFMILGGSGCGKSTLLRTLVGLLPPLGGAMEVAGLTRPAEHRGRPRFGVMFQMGALFGSMTLEQNVSLPLEVWTDLDARTIREVALSKLALVGLEGAGDKLPSEISGGMNKRASIARALALDPPLLFLDEPSAGLDPVSSASLDELILSLCHDHGSTVVIVTHELPSIFRLGGRCLMLDREAGTSIALGTPEELRDHPPHPAVRAFFRREAEVTP